jgi:hypothetical protein
MKDDRKIKFDEPVGTLKPKLQNVLGMKVSKI